MTAKQAIQEEEYAGRFSLDLWRRLLRYALPYRAQVWGLLLVAAVLAGLNGSSTLVTRYVFNDVVARGPRARLPEFGAALFAITLISCLDILVFIRLAGRICTGMSHDIRRAGFDHLQELSFSYFDRRPAGWLVARLTSDCDRLSNTLAWGMLDMTWGLCMVAGLSVIMLVLNWKLAMVVLSVVPALVWVSLAFQKRILPASRAIRKQNSRITASYNECILGARTTKTLVRERENLRDFQEMSGKMYADSVRNAVLSSAYFPIIMLLGNVGAGLALWVGGRDAMVGSLKVGDLLLFVGCAGQLIWPVFDIARVFADFQTTQASAERVLGLIGAEPEVKDSSEVLAAMEARRGHEGDDGLAVDGLPNRIEQVQFRNVCFAYADGEPVLEDFNLTVRAGQTIALVGPTGGGKTTIVSLMCRFYEPTSGEILINGVEYRKRGLKWLQSKLGIVLQQPHLFSGTVRENIRYGRLDADQAAIERAARLVRAHEFILRQEKGYDTEVGEGGGKLSTGQKQLVSFARAVLADPQIFVMDEATSSVDTETEKAIQEGLHAVLTGRISFIIAHRLSTIRSADLILVIEDGRVIEQGSHHDLIRLRGHYYELYTNQFTEEKATAILAHAE